MKFLKFLVIFLILLFIPLLFILIDRTHQKEITIATGSKNGAYYAYALAYQKRLETYGIKLNILTTQGSLHAQDKLLAKEVDFAFIQGGTEIKDQGLLALANIAYEPIWIFSREQNLTSLLQLKGKKVALGTKASGIYPVASTLLATSGLDQNNTEFFYPINYEALTLLQSDQIDAMFYIAAPRAKLVRILFETPNIFLFNFTNAYAYQQYFLNHAVDFHILTLEAGGFDIQSSLPKSKHTLLAKKTILATYNKTSDTIVRLMLKVADQVHNQAGMFHQEDTFPNDTMLKLQQHPASVQYFKEKEHYYEGITNFWTAQSLNKLHHFGLLFLIPLITLFAFFVEVIMPTIHWYGRRKIIVWYDKINKLDTGIEQLPLDEAETKKKILQQMLQEVRTLEDIPPTHMEEFYTLQNQIANILDDLEKRISYLSRLQGIATD